MDKLKPIVRVPLKFGAVAAVLLIILIVILYYAGKHPLFIPVVIDIRLFILPVFIFLALKEFREYYNNSVLHFWQGLAVSWVCYTTIGVLVGIFIFTFIELFEPDFLQQFIDFYTNQMVQNKEQFLNAIGEEAYEQGLQDLPLTSAADLAFDYLWKTLIMGILLSIIISVILRRQPKL